MRARWNEMKHFYSILKKTPLFFIGLFIILTMVTFSMLAPTLTPDKYANLSSCDNSIDYSIQTTSKGLPPLSIDQKVTQINNDSFPLPDMPSDLTTAIPAIGLVNNDTSNDLVVGGNTGYVYVSLNNGTNTNPVWSPWVKLQDKRTGEPFHVNGTTTPSIIDTRATRQVPLRWPTVQYGQDIIVTSSASNIVDHFISKPYGWYNLGYAMNKSALFCSGIDPDTYQPIPNFAPPDIAYRCFGQAVYNYTIQTEYTLNNQTVFYKHYTTIGSSSIVSSVSNRNSITYSGANSSLISTTPGFNYLVIIASLTGKLLFIKKRRGK